MRKTLCYIVGLGLLLMALTGCAKLMPTPEPVTITFAYPERDTAYYETLVQEFQEQNGYITVELVKAPRSFAQTLQNDIFIADQLVMPQLLQQESVLNVTPFIEQDEDFNVDDFYPGTLDAFSYEGKTWGVPSDLDMMVMYYNQDIFDRYGVAYPQPGWTWRDFLDAATQTTDRGADIFGYAIQYNDEFGVIEPILVIYQHGGQLFDNWQNPQLVTFNEPLNIEALEWYAGLIYNFGVAPTKQEGPDVVRHYPNGGAMEGKYAMWMGMLSDHGGKTWGRPWPMRWGVVPLPRDQAATTLALINGLFISAQTAHPDECWKWVSFLSQQMPTASLPARKSLATSDAYVQMVGSDVSSTARAAMRDAILINPELLGYEKALAALMEAFTEVRNGTTTPEAALNDAQEKAGF